MTILHTENPDAYRDQESSGRYYHLGGEQFMSVTTALRLGLPSGYLMKWYARLIAEYVADDPSHLEQQRDTLERDDFIRYLKGMPEQVRDEAGDFGSLVHELAERYVLSGEKPTVEEHGAAAVKRIDLYRHWIDTMKPEFIAVEGVCYSRRHRFAGTMDMIVDLPEHGRVVVDIKSGSGVYGSAALQQTAYRRAEFIAVGDQEIPMPKTRGAMILHLQKTQWRLLPVETRGPSWSAFLHALHTAYWIAGTGENSERAAVGQPVAKGKPVA